MNHRFPSVGGPFFLLLLLLLLLFVGAAAPRYGGEVVIALPPPLEVVPPPLAEGAAARFLDLHLYETLFRIDEGGVPRPNLLIGASWEVEEGRRFRFRLLPDLHFHDGVLLTAHDVVASLRRLLDPRVDSPYWWILRDVEGGEAFHRGEGTRVGIVAPDPFTVEITFSRPVSDLPLRLAHPATAVMPRHRKLASSLPVGSGPFRFIEARKGRIVLAANPQHHEGRPFLDRIVVVEERVDRTPERRIDLHFRDPAPRFPELEAKERFLPPASTTLLLWNRGKAAIAEGERALRAAIDKGDLVRTYLAPGTEPGRGILPDRTVFYAALRHEGTQAPPFPPSRAEGPKIRFLVPKGGETVRRLARRIEVFLEEKLGWHARIEFLEERTLQRRLAAGRFDLALLFWHAAFPDPFLALEDFCADAARFLPGGAGEACQRVPRLSTLSDPSARWEALFGIEEEIGEALPVLFLFHPVVGLEGGGRLTGIRFSPGGLPLLADAWWSKR
ncbi:MAG: ABC transporter substrate-binding protein [Deltaproteobacteria bacterium]|nr:MAG: ABC transporter substrate-binding protein [Deltaproteobacteria bacterium]